MQSKEYIIAQVNEILENHTVYMNLPQWTRENVALSLYQILANSDMI
ncbi:hypothetical protein [Clostridium saccharoperbutylacetonicum]